MANVLFVSYHFPPIGGAGVQRAVKFVRYLPEFGFRPVVVTGPGQHDHRWTPDDPSMLGEIGDIPVFRATGPIPHSTTGVKNRTARLLGRQNAFIRWWIDSVVRLGQTHGRDVDLVLGELGPYETGFGLARLARTLGVPWVAVLADPWALDEMWLYPTALHRFADRRRMRKTLGTAAAVVMNTPEAVIRLREAFPEFRDRPVLSIPMGYDAGDFAGEPPPRTDEVFRIVHTGSLHTDSGLRHRRTRHLRRLLGGMPVPGVDILTRSHVFLLEALKAVLRDDPGLRGVVELHLAGALTDADRLAAADASFVHFAGYKSHEETISLIRTADLLFLPMQELPDGIRAGLVPAKTYEYMASGVPILAGVPDGDARDILLSAGIATLCRPAAVECLAAALRERIAAWRNHVSNPAPDPAVPARFEYRRLAGELAILLDEVVDNR